MAERGNGLDVIDRNTTVPHFQILVAISGMGTFSPLIAPANTNELVWVLSCQSYGVVCMYAWAYCVGKARRRVALVLGAVLLAVATLCEALLVNHPHPFLVAALGCAGGLVLAWCTRMVMARATCWPAHGIPNSLIVGLLWSAVAVALHTIDLPMMIAAAGGTLGLLIAILSAVRHIPHQLRADDHAQTPYRSVPTSLVAGRSGPSPYTSRGSGRPRQRFARVPTWLLITIISALIAIGLSIQSVRQFMLLRAKEQWLRSPSCTTMAGRVLLDVTARSLNADVAHTALVSNTAYDESDTRLLLAVRDGSEALSPGQLAYIGNNIRSVCRVGDRYGGRTVVVVANADVVAVDVELRVRSSAGSPNSRATVDEFQKVVAENVARSFRAGGVDARRLSARCWQPDHVSLMNGASAILLVHPDIDILTNGSHDFCFGDPSRVAFPALGRVSVIVMPDQSMIPR